MEKIGLDQPTLKALAGETRVRILKLLDKKQLTQSDMANELKMSLPTVGEHIKALELAELVEREQTERKWKYYSLTSKARVLLHPNTTTIWFVLGMFLFSAVATVINAVKYFSPVAQLGSAAEAKMMAADALAEAAPALAQEAMARTAPIASQASPVWLIAFGAAAVVMLIVLVVLLHRHGWLGSSLSNKKNI